MSDEDPCISIALSPAQVDAVVRAATHSRVPSVSTLIGSALRAPLRDEDAAGGSAAGAHTAGEEIGSGSAGNGHRRREQRVLGRHLACDESADPRMSRSLLRGLSLLTRFGADGAERGIVELARELGMSPSTAHRYAFTLVELGLLERSPRTRKYRLPGTG